MPLIRRILPSQDYLRECFDYDPETGILTWRQRPRSHFATDRACNSWNKRYPGTQPPPGAGGYLMVGIKYDRLLVHRVIWKWMTGDEPPPDVDHSDRNRTNNRWTNLRIATRQQTTWNSDRPNVTGFRGVSIQKGRYRAQANIDGKLVRLGYFNTPEAAHEAYCRAVRDTRGDFWYKLSHQK